MSEYRGPQYLKALLAVRKARNDERYEYYEMKERMDDISNIIPKGFEHLKEVLGWCTKAVDSLADRLTFREFDEDHFDMNTIYNMNNPDIIFDSAIVSALITSCSFIYISAGEDGFPRLQVIDGRRATGIIDPITNMLKEGYAVLEIDADGNPLLEAYFTSESTVYYPAGGAAYSKSNIAPYPLLVPVIFRPDPKRPFGHSRISRACMNIQQSAMRTLKRSEVAAEFYSYPQKYILGIDNDAEMFDTWRASISSMLQVGTNEEGNNPSVGQFSQQSMAPYSEQLKMFASLFAAETGLTLDDLGFSTDNPSSVDAIKAQHENLRLTARKAQRTFGAGFLNAGYLASCLRDNFPYRRDMIYLTKPKWEPLFEPDSSTLSVIGDGAVKINQAVPDYFGKDNLRDLTGIDYDDDVSAFSRSWGEDNG